MKDGLQWWSMMVVVPALRESSNPASKHACVESRSRARSIFHQTSCKISVKFVGLFFGRGIPTARAEYKWW